MLLKVCLGMSQDIRNFFTPKGKSSATPKQQVRTAITDEKEKPITPTRPAQKEPKRKRKVIISDSESEEEDAEALFDKKYQKSHKVKNVVKKNETTSSSAKSMAKKSRVVIESDSESNITEEPPKKIQKKPAGGLIAKPAVKPVTKEVSQPKKISPKPLRPIKDVVTISDSPVKKSPKKVEKRPPKVNTAESLNLPPLNMIGGHKLEQWVDKYKPTEINKVVGQQTGQSMAQKLLKWLRDWPKHNLGAAGAVKKSKPPGFSQGDGSAFKSALISGPPGIGKTTMAILACQELGLKYKEMNASLARNKKQLEQHVQEFTHSKHMTNFYGVKSTKPAVQSGGYKVEGVLIMDEVDGMSGNQDRAGIAELIQMIKKSEIPIICICNDRQSQKIRSLANHCFDLRVPKPRKEQIMACLLAIAAKEKLKVDKTSVEKIVIAANQDVRQSIYSLQLLAAGQKGTLHIDAKNVELNIFEAAHQLFSKDTDLRRKRELFFSDYSMMPLFVQENYLAVRSTEFDRSEQLAAMAKAASCIAYGDQMSKFIRQSQNWSLLPAQGTVGCALPPLFLGAGKGAQVDGYLTSQLGFPAWFGKNSTMKKRHRLVKELQDHMGLRMSGPVHSIATDYVPVLRNRLLQPLADSQADGIPEVVETYHAYDLVKDDMEAINEIGLWDPNKDIAKKIETKTKAALTRALNKDPQKHHYTTKNDVVIPTRTKGNKRAAATAASAKLQNAINEKEGSDEEEVEEENAEVEAELFDAF
ncbi:unnamed protein product [Bursaphelenchus xylophilus]|uniref:(pine wood nematode) hypothetical protein n=1 Tax=Bursaphelenchus xylophilus TaxID=6326 RepID=A0A1I7RVD3_BURXY|nr:unnamed protein product [Bursaphelenchus xylophilus]CAG9086698.1 unnamed protein product [Bursaphelenchus xylophilus]